jgi:anti-sigma factor RsiW
MKGEEERVMSEAVKRRGCENFADRLVDYSDGELAEGERQLVSNHVVSCAGCRAELARLDASRDVLTRAILFHEQRDSIRTISVDHKAGAARIKAGAARIVAKRRFAAWATVAALGLVCVSGALWFGSKTIGKRHAQEVVQAPAVRQPDLAPKITPREALWHVALIEQQARLQASLDLLPRDGVYAAQRVEDERLLAKFQSMVRFEEIQ